MESFKLTESLGPLRMTDESIQYLLFKTEMIWASSKHMFMLTNSELAHWDIDRKQYCLRPTTFDPANRFENFEEYLRSLLRPYMIKSQVRQITIVFDFPRFDFH
jgi:hypothetical protein